MKEISLIQNDFLNDSRMMEYYLSGTLYGRIIGQVKVS